MSDPGSTADRGTAEKAVEDRGLAPVRTPGPPRVLRTRIQVRWIEDDVELYHRVVRTIAETREFEGIPLHRLWQPFHGESTSLFLRHLGRVKEGSALTIHVHALDDPATSTVVRNGFLRSDLDLRQPPQEPVPEHIELDPEVIQGKVPRSTPTPVDKDAGGVRTEIHRAISRRPRIKVVRDFEDWSTGDMVQAIREEGSLRDTESSPTWMEYRNKWVHAHRPIIKAVAREYDLPELLVAGVAWIEVGGKPPALDDAAFEKRRFRGNPLLTSYGHVAIQLRRAAEELGYDLEAINHLQVNQIIESLRDPQQNLFIVGRHLDRLRNVDFPGKPASLMSDEDVRITASRYVRGPDVPLESLEEEAYGKRILNRKEQILGLLEEPNAPAH